METTPGDLLRIRKGRGRPCGERTAAIEEKLRTKVNSMGGVIKEVWADDDWKDDPPAQSTISRIRVKKDIPATREFRLTRAIGLIRDVGGLFWSGVESAVAIPWSGEAPTVGACTCLSETNGSLLDVFRRAEGCPPILSVSRRVESFHRFMRNVSQRYPKSQAIYLIMSSHDILNEPTVRQCLESRPNLRVLAFSDFGNLAETLSLGERTARIISFVVSVAGSLPSIPLLTTRFSSWVEKRLKGSDSRPGAFSWSNSHEQSAQRGAATGLR